MPSNGSWIFGLLYSFTGSANLPGAYDSLTMDAAGNLYGTTTKDGAHCRRLGFQADAGQWRLDRNDVSTSPAAAEEQFRMAACS